MYTQTGTHSRVSAPPLRLLRMDLRSPPCSRSPTALPQVLPQGPPCTHRHQEPLTPGTGRAISSQDRHGQTSVPTSHWFHRTSPFCPLTPLFPYAYSLPRITCIHPFPHFWFLPEYPRINPVQSQNTLPRIPHRVHAPGECPQSQSRSGITQSPRLLAPRWATHSPKRGEHQSRPPTCSRCWFLPSDPIYPITPGTATSPGTALGPAQP